MGGLVLEHRGNMGEVGQMIPHPKHIQQFPYIQCCTLLQPPPEDDAASPAVHGAPDNQRHTRVGRQTVHNAHSII